MRVVKLMCFLFFFYVFSFMNPISLQSTIAETFFVSSSTVNFDRKMSKNI